MNDLLSPKQVARAIGLSESSLKRYCDQGVIQSVRTAGGHRKLPLNDVLRFVRERKHTLVSPDALNALKLRSPSSRSEIGLARGVDLLVEALLQGDEESVWRIVFDLYLAKHSISVICDRLICPAFREIGVRWSCGAIEVYQERRSCELIQRILYNLRTTQKSPDPEWIACGGTIDGDSATLSSAMAELVLRDSGWNATTLGTCVPVESMVKALQNIRPKLFWLCVYAINDVSLFVDQVMAISEMADYVGAAFVIYGRGISEDIRLQLLACTCVISDSMQQLEGIGKTIRRIGAPMSEVKEIA